VKRFIVFAPADDMIKPVVDKIIKRADERAKAQGTEGPAANEPRKKA
jgi:hypothetical protein